MKIFKKWSLWGLFGILPLLLVSVGIVYALPAKEVETTYFSDASMEDEVGGTILSCQGGVYRWGKRSRYAVRYETPCNTSGQIGVSCRVDGIVTTCPVDICNSSLFVCQ